VRNPLKTVVLSLWLLGLSGADEPVVRVQSIKATEGTGAGVLKQAHPGDVQPFRVSENSTGYVRDRYLTDPDFVQAPLDRLLSDEHFAALRARLDPTCKGGPDSAPIDGDTCYLCAVDQDGNAVSLIQSVYFDFGSGVVAGDTGVLMQNRGAFFSLDDAHPNRLEPRKRTFHTLIPAMLMEGGQPAMVYGNMGGEGQPQSQAAVLTRVVDFGYDVQRAIEAPRWLYGRTWGTESAALSIEEDLGPDVARQLAAMGHDVEVVPTWSDSMGHAQAIRIDRQRGVLWAGADPRSDGAAAGW